MIIIHKYAYSFSDTISSIFILNFNNIHTTALLNYQRTISFGKLNERQKETFLLLSQGAVQFFLEDKLHDSRPNQKDIKHIGFL